MPMPLEGYRVIDWTIWQQGPICSTMLGDMGAEVIKIEHREGGDPGRGLLSLAGVDLKDRPNFYFEANNRNKKSLTLDLKQPEAKEIVYRLIQKSDVFVQNYRKGVAGRLGLGYETLKSHNPMLIYASATGYGPEGPESGDPSFDQLGLGRSGIMMAVGEPDADPQQISGGIADQMGGIMLAYGIITALLARERFGVGQEVDASHLGSMSFLQGLSLSARLMMGMAIPKTPRREATNPLWNHYRCGDNQWLILGMLQPDRYWADLCECLGRSDLAIDSRYSEIRARATNATACIDELDKIFASKPRAEWVEILRSKGDFIFSVINRVDDLPDDPQIHANDYVVDFDHPSFGTTQVVGIPVRLSETPGSIREPSPELGQHTEEILTGLLDYSWEEVGRFKETGVI